MGEVIPFKTRKLLSLEEDLSDATEYLKQLKAGEFSSQADPEVIYSLKDACTSAIKRIEEEICLEADRLNTVNKS